jgi:hypothetical protein
MTSFTASPTSGFARSRPDNGAMRRLTCIIVAVVGFLGISLAPAYAQVPPPPVPLPTVPPLPVPLPIVPAPPPEAAPVFELVAPMAYQTCGIGLLALFLGRTAVPQVATQLNQAPQPLFAICGAVPAPPAILRCSLDAQAQAVLDQAEGALGVPPGIAVWPEGQVVEEIVVLEDHLPPPANAAGLGALAVATLDCKPIEVPPLSGNGSPPPPPSNVGNPLFRLPAPASIVGPPGFAAGLRLPPNASSGLQLPPSALSPSQSTAVDGSQNSVRRAVGTFLGVTLLLLSILYWADGFGAVPLRSALIQRSSAPLRVKPSGPQTPPSAK